MVQLPCLKSLRYHLGKINYPLEDISEKASLRESAGNIMSAEDQALDKGAHLKIATNHMQKTKGKFKKHS